MLALSVGSTTLEDAVLYQLRYQQLDAQTIMGGTDMKGPSTAAESLLLNPNLGGCDVHLKSIRSRRFQSEQ